MPQHHQTIIAYRKSKTRKSHSRSQPALNVVLYQPEFPANVGNIIRLCANTHTQLHIIFPIPFQLEDKKLLRAGLDYHEFVNIQTYLSYEHFCQAHPQARVWALTTKSSQNYHKFKFKAGDFFMFGPETRGLPEEVRKQCYGRLRIPMAKNNRSMNLANSVSICLYEGLRQLHFPDLH